MGADAMSGALPPIPQGFKLEAQGGPDGMPAPPGQAALPPIPAGWQLDTSAPKQQPVDRSLSSFLKRPSVPAVIINAAGEYASDVGEHFMSGFTRMGQGLHEAIDTPTASLQQGNVLTGVPRAIFGGLGAVAAPVTAAIAPVLGPVIGPIAGAVNENIGKPIEAATGYPADITNDIVLQAGSYGLIKGGQALGRAAIGGKAAGASARAAVDEFAKIGQKPTLAQAMSGSNSTIQYLARLLEFTPGGYLPFRGRIKSQLEAAAKRIDDALTKAGQASQIDAGLALQTGAKRFAEKVSKTASRLEAKLEKAVPGTTATMPQNTLTALNEIAGTAGQPSAVARSIIPASMKRALDDFQADIASNGGVTFQTLKDFRTRIGAKTDTGQALIRDISAGQMAKLYKALTKDMEDVADAAGKGDLVKLRNSYYSKRKGEVEDIFERRIKQDRAPEEVYRAVRDADLSQGARIMKQLSPQERRTVMGQVLHEMGKPTPGDAAGDTATFSLERFDSNVAKLSGTPGKGGDKLDAFFNMSGTQDLRAALKEVSAVSERFKAAEKFLRNPSQSAVVGTQLGTLGAIGGAALIDPVTALGYAGIAYGVPYALARGGNSAAFIRLIAGIGKQNKSTLPGHILRMSAFVQQNPEYAPALKQMLEKAQQPEPQNNQRR